MNKDKKGISKISIILICIIILGIAVGAIFLLKGFSNSSSTNIFNVGSSTESETRYSFNNKENYIAVKNKDEKYGFIDTNGNQKIDFKYEFAEDYINGLAIVHNEDYEEGIIDTKGNEIVKFGEFSNIYRYNESQNVTSEYSNIFIATTDDGQKKFINKDGKVVTTNAYEDIDEKNGIIYFENNGKYGLLDINGKEILTSDEEFDVEDTCDSISVLSFDNCNKIINNVTGKVLKEIEAESYSEINKYGNYYEVQNSAVVKDNEVIYISDNDHSIIDINEEGIVHLQNIVRYDSDENANNTIFYSLETNKKILDISNENNVVLLSNLLIYEENDELYSVDKKGNKTNICNIKGMDLESGIGNNIVLVGDSTVGDSNDNHAFINVETKEKIREVGYHIEVGRSLESLYGEIFKGIHSIREHEFDKNLNQYKEEYIYIVDSNLNKIADNFSSVMEVQTSKFTYELTRKKYIILYDTNGKVGIIDETGKNIVEFKYDDASGVENVPVICLKKDKVTDIYDLSKEKIILSLDGEIPVLYENYIRTDNNKIYNYDGKLIYTEE